MKTRRVVSVILAALFAAVLAAWLVAMPGEGPVLYVLGIVAFGVACASCGLVAVRPNALLKGNGAAVQPLVIRAITFRTS